MIIDGIGAGFPLLPTLDHPHWTVVVSQSSPERFGAVREQFSAPVFEPSVPSHEELASCL